MIFFLLIFWIWSKYFSTFYTFHLIVFECIFHFTKSVIHSSKLLNFLRYRIVIFLIVLFLRNIFIIWLFQKNKLGFQIALMFIIDNWFLCRRFELRGKKRFTIGKSIIKFIWRSKWLFYLLNTILFFLILRCLLN